MGEQSDDANAQAMRSLAIITSRRSWQHLAVSVAMGAAMLAWFARKNAPPYDFIVVAGIGVFLVVYNIARIARARAALHDPARLHAFAAGQRRSHRVRGRIYLVGAPILIGVTWAGTLMGARPPVEDLAVLVAVTLFPLVCWVLWLRAVRHLRA